MIDGLDIALDKARQKLGIDEPRPEPLGMPKRMREALNACGFEAEEIEWDWPMTEPLGTVFYDWSCHHGFPYWA